MSFYPATTILSAAMLSMKLASSPVLAGDTLPTPLPTPGVMLRWGLSRGFLPNATRGLGGGGPGRIRTPKKKPATAAAKAPKAETPPGAKKKTKKPQATG